MHGKLGSYSDTIGGFRGDSVNVRTNVELMTSRKLKAIKELFGLNNLGQALDMVVAVCSDDILASPELRMDVAKRFQADIEAARRTPDDDGMSEKDILDLCGVTKDEVEAVRKSNKENPEVI